MTDKDAGGYAAIATHLRAWIVGEDIQPGTALPKQTELADRFEVSSLTIGRAMRELQDDGFVVAIRRAGTYISETPPHLNRYVLVFPHLPKVLANNRFMQALANEAVRLAEERGITIDCLYGLDGNKERDSYKELLHDIERRRLAGILFATPPFLLEKTPIVNEPGIPRAAMMQPDEKHPHIAPITFAEPAFAERAFERLQAEGRSRIAVLASPGTLEAWAKLLAARAPEFGLETRPYWLQSVAQHTPVSGRRCMHLMFSPEQSVRPDALIVADDNLLEDASIGLVDAGISVPRVLGVIAHCNFPWPAPSRVPVSRLGFDAREVLERMLDATDHQRHGEKQPAMPPQQPLFEEEFQARRAPVPALRGQGVHSIFSM